MTTKTKGPGRPALPEGVKKRQICIKLPPDVLEWIWKQDGSPAKVVEGLVRREIGKPTK